MKNTLKSGFVKGHDFSHADKVNRTTGLQPPREYLKSQQAAISAPKQHNFTQSTAFS
jgi:hypothetical protein